MAGRVDRVRGPSGWDDRRCSSTLGGGQGPTSQGATNEQDRVIPSGFMPPARRSQCLPVTTETDVAGQHEESPVFEGGTPQDGAQAPAGLSRVPKRSSGCPCRPDCCAVEA